MMQRRSFSTFFGLAAAPLILAILAPSQLACAPPSSSDPSPPATESASDSKRRRPATSRWFERNGVTEALELSAEQIEQLMSIGDDQISRVREVRKKERRAFLRFIRSLNEEPLKPERIAMTQSEVEVIVAERTRLATSSLLAIRKALTKQQWQKIPDVAPGVLQMGSFRFSGSSKVFISDQEPEKVTGAPLP